MRWGEAARASRQAVMETMENPNNPVIAANGGILNNEIIARMFIALNIIIVCWDMGMLPVCWEFSRHLERDVFAPRSS